MAGDCEAVGVIEGDTVGETDGELLMLADGLPDTLTDGATEREGVAEGDTEADGDVDGLVDGLADGDAEVVGERDAGLEGSFVMFALGEAPRESVAVAVAVAEGVGRGSACEHEKRTLSVFWYTPASCRPVVHGSGGVAALDHAHSLLGPSEAPAKQIVCSSEVKSVVQAGKKAPSPSVPSSHTYCRSAGAVDDHVLAQSPAVGP